MLIGSQKIILNKLKNNLDKLFELGYNFFCGSDGWVTLLMEDV